MKYNYFVYLLVMALVTYLIRMLPLILLKKKITNPVLLSFLEYVPYAVLSAMTVPAIFSCTNHPITAIFGFVVALILAYQNGSLMLVASGASVAVFIGEILLSII